MSSQNSPAVATTSEAATTVLTQVDHHILPEAQPSEPTNSSLVEEAVASSHQSITSICANDTPCIPKTMFHSSSLEIDSQMNDKSKAKIWNNEYV